MKKCDQLNRRHRSKGATGMISVDGVQLRSALQHHASGVTVLTAPGPVGFTATSFTSVSLDPPLVSFCLATGASARAAVDRADYFGVNILGSDQEVLALGFARSGVDRFENVLWTADEYGIPLIDGVPAWLRCRIFRRQLLGDHVQIVGEVLEVGGRTVEEAGPGSALVHHGGRIVGVEGAAIDVLDLIASKSDDVA
jgi:flavin reductase (DIM6/NTAB) family NADH-FMN oxidoreductase RutF